MQKLCKSAAGILVAASLVSCQESTSVDKTSDKPSNTNCASESVPKGCVDGRLIHVPSPDWRDQIIYFLMIDRFEDGEPSNNDQGVGLYDPSKESHYSGGDIRGIVDRVDYIKALGATAVWTTPHVANMWWDPITQYGGYHGYWARDFKGVDEHYGTLDDYKDLSNALHTRGMYLVQDIVVNHVGNYFYYDGEYDPQDVTKNFRLNEKAIPGSAPVQAPFNMVDVNNPEHRAADIYHWTTEISNFKDPVQETTYKTGGLSDINTSNPVVREALKDSFGYWIQETGVDAFRIDTVKYVEAEFYEDFIYGDKGILETAKGTGREDFYTFGEVFNTSAPYSDKGEIKLNKYLTTQDKKRIDAPIGFPLYKEMNRVFAGGSPTAYLSYRLDAQMRIFNEPYLVANFIDNHDVERFLAGGSVEGLKLAYALMMTVPGVPVIYQGDEQLFVDFRKSMFAGGYQSEKDYFDQEANMFKYISSLAQIRLNHKVFTRGKIEILQDNEIGPGVFAFKRSYEGKVAYVVMNSSKGATLLNGLATPFKKGGVQPDVLFSENISESLNFDASGVLTQVLPGSSAIIFYGDDAEIEQVTLADTNDININKIEERYENQSLALIEGTVSEAGAELKLVIDGNLDKAKKFKAGEDGSWSVALPVRDLGEKSHFLEIFWPEKTISSERKNYTVLTSEAEYEASIEDPKGDDKGPSGTYIKPQHESYGCEMDLENVLARSGGSVLELTLTMCNVSDLWTPTNQFDHVAYTIYFDINAGGVKPLPLLDANFPGDGAWEYAHMAYGWGNYIFDGNNASKTREGNKLGIAADIEVNKEENQITFRYFGDQFGIESWGGVKIYITTWDKDGGGAYRHINEDVGPWNFGGAPAGSPRIHDDVLVELK